MGAGLGAATTLGDALVHEQVTTSDLRDAAENGAAGAALGTAGSAVGRSAATGFDRVAGQGAERLASSAGLSADGALIARSAASELGGAGGPGRSSAPAFRSTKIATASCTAIRTRSAT